MDRIEKLIREALEWLFGKELGSKEHVCSNAVEEKIYDDS